MYLKQTKEKPYKNKYFEFFYALTHLIKNPITEKTKEKNSLIIPSKYITYNLQPTIPSLKTRMIMRYVHGV